MSTTARMMNTSAKLSPAQAAVRAERAAAASSTTIIGSAICCKKRWNRLSFLARRSSLGPVFASRAAACPAVRPSGPLPWAANASRAVC